MITVMSCCYVSMSCHVMSCHGMSAWVVFGLATLPFRMQVRFHDDIDGSSLARAIYASTGPLLFPLIQGFSHTHTYITCLLPLHLQSTIYTHIICVLHLHGSCTCIFVHTPTPPSAHTSTHRYIDTK